MLTGFLSLMVLFLPVVLMAGLAAGISHQLAIYLKSARWPFIMILAAMGAGIVFLLLLIAGILMTAGYTDEFWQRAALCVFAASLLTAFVGLPVSYFYLRRRERRVGLRVFE